MARILGSHPEVHLVHEPDNRNLDVLGWLGTGVVGAVPTLRPGDDAPDYRRMWRVAFAGGWARTGPLAVPTAALLRVARLPAGVPTPLRSGALRAAAAVSAREHVRTRVVLVKSVGATSPSTGWPTPSTLPSSSCGGTR